MGKTCYESSEVVMRKEVLFDHSVHRSDGRAERPILVREGTDIGRRRETHRRRGNLACHHHPQHVSLSHEINLGSDPRTRRDVCVPSVRTSRSKPCARPEAERAVRPP